MNEKFVARERLFFIAEGAHESLQVQLTTRLCEGLLFLRCGVNEEGLASPGRV